MRLETAVLLLITVMAAAPPAPAQDAAWAELPPAVEVVCQQHAAALLEVAGHALDARLLNDAARLELESKWWDSRQEALPAFEARCRAAQLASVRGEDKDAFRSFWASKEYASVRTRILSEETGAARACLRALEKVARRAQQDGTVLDAVARVALELELQSDAQLSSAVGRDRLERARRKREAERHIDRLELGDVVAGAPVDQKTLRGKVVLWRSFSL